MAINSEGKAGTHKKSEPQAGFDLFNFRQNGARQRMRGKTPAFLLYYIPIHQASFKT